MPPLPAALTSSMLYFQMVIMAGTVMLAYYFEYTDTFTVNVQGFFCHDSAYRKPYPGPEDSSAVPPVLLYSLAAGVPVLVVSPGVLARAPVSLLSPFALGVEAPRRIGARQPLPSKFLQVACSPFPRGHSSRARQGGCEGSPGLFPHATPASPVVAAVLGDGAGDGREGGCGR